MANRSSYVNIYAKEDKTDNAKRVELEATNAGFTMKGAQDFVADFAKYSFTKADDSVFDLEVRFNALETDATGSNNAAAITALQAADAAESNARQAADTANANAIVAETNARVAAVAGVQAALDTQESKQATETAANAAAVTAEASARTTADSAENVRALAAEAALGVRIDNVIGASVPANLDSLKEIIDHLDAGDAALLAAVNANAAQAAENKARLDELLLEQ